MAALAFAIVHKAPRATLLLGLTGVLLAVISHLASLLPYESQAVVIFDSPGTLRRLIADPADLFNRVKDTSRSLRRDGQGGHFDSQMIALEPDTDSTHLTIRIRNRNRFDAQIAVQVVINHLIDSTRAARVGINEVTWRQKGPWVEVLDPPSLPILTIGELWLSVLFYAGLTLTISAALTLAFNRVRRRGQLTPHPA
jgi:hypothetical protein